MRIGKKVIIGLKVQEIAEIVACVDLRKRDIISKSKLKQNDKNLDRVLGYWYKQRINKLSKILEKLRKYPENY